MSKLTRTAEERASWLAQDLVHECAHGDGTDMRGSTLLRNLANELQTKYHGQAIHPDAQVLINQARERASWLASRIVLGFNHQPTSHVEDFPLAGDWFYGPTLLWKLLEAVKKPLVAQGV